MLQHKQQQLATASASRRRATTAARPLTTAAATTARRRARAPLFVASAAAACAVADAPEQQQQTKPAVIVRPYSGESELHAVARLRAEAYHESDSSRFAATFKKQFAEREAASLRQRTAVAAGSTGTPPRCECLVAVAAEAPGDSNNTSTSSQEVLGCIDLRPPPHAAASSASATSGVPPEDAAEGAYLLNVVVSERARGRGVGEALMRAAMRRARREHGARRAYTHVEAGNGSAARLYARCGFRESGEERGALAGASELGRVLLLKAELDGLDGEE